MMPLYGFLQGDTIGLLVLADEEDTAATLAQKLISAASVRVKPPASTQVVWKGRRVPPDVTLTRAGFEALDRFDVVATGGS
jgi:hypothetical protein